MAVLRAPGTELELDLHRPLVPGTQLLRVLRSGRPAADPILSERRTPGCRAQALPVRKLLQSPARLADDTQSGVGRRGSVPGLSR